MTKATHSLNVELNPNKEDSESQLYTLINHFLTGGPPLTVLTAIKYYGIFALSQRIGQLINMGFPVKKEWLTLPNGKRIKQYSL
jgi:hypothetical protein